MNKVTLSVAAVAVASSFVACGGNNTDSTQSRQHFIETQYIDSTTKPGDDFFQFVNGRWLDTVKIPDDKGRIGAFDQLRDDNQEKLHTIVQDLLNGQYETGSIEQKVGDFYASGMDTATRDSRGYEPIQPMLAAIDGINDIPSLMDYVASAAKRGDNSIIGFSVAADQKNSSMNIAILHQTGLGLPDRDYYFKDDKATLNVQQAYKTMVSELFRLTGTEAAQAEKDAETVYRIEKQIAESHKSRVELRDVMGNYNKMPLSSLTQLTPNISWVDLFKNMGVNGVDSLDVEQPAYYVKLSQMLASTPIDQWKLYLKSSTIQSYATVLSSAFDEASFNYAKALTGNDKQEDLWKRMVTALDRNLGELLGQLYVEKYFPKEAKQRMDQLVTNLAKAFSNRIQQLDWMSDSTKVTAQEKLTAIVRKIGYPTKWRDYDQVQVDKTKYFENVISARENNYNFKISQLGNPVDRTLWYMTPPTVNAYYDPTLNEIAFPAGILQFPFFDKDADDAVNYGAIGMVIGHEMTHGFDDQGSQYDKVGNIQNWWTKADKEKFDQKVKSIQTLYDGFTVLDSVHVNGQLTTGENMADFGGLAIAWDAFKMTQQGQDTTKIDGYTPDQRFFMSLAQIWRTKSKEATTRRLINTDPHSPAIWRVLGPLMNFDPFYQAFDVQPGDKMYIEPKDRIKIW